MSAATMENSMQAPQKIKTYDPANPFLGIYSKTINLPSQRDIQTPMFTAALFTIAKTWKQHKCPLTFGLKNMICLFTYLPTHLIIFIYDAVLFSHDKEGNPAIFNNMSDP